MKERSDEMTMQQEALVYLHACAREHNEKVADEMYRRLKPLVDKEE